MRDSLQEDRTVGTGTSGKAAAVLRDGIKAAQTRVVGIELGWRKIKSSGYILVIEQIEFVLYSMGEEKESSLIVNLSQTMKFISVEKK